MDHNYAIENHTAERYLLHELNEEERDAYEEHFFSCSACADEVKIASEFLESARHVVQDEVTAQLYGQVVRRSIWGSWLNFRSMLHPMPAMACGLLVVVSVFSGYQSRVTIPELRQKASPQLVRAPFTLKTAREAPPVFTASHGQALALRFSIPAEEPGSYKAELIDSTNSPKATFDNISVQDAYPLEITVPPDTLAPGNYVVLITDEKSKGEVERFTFELKVQN